MDVKTATGSARVQSVDMMRGLVIFVMIFANFGFMGAPWFMEHYYYHDPDAFSGATYVDYIFSMFLLMVGISIPLAFRKYEDSWRGRWRLVWHILLRGGSMLFIGVIWINQPNLDKMGDWSFMNGWWDYVGIPHAAGAAACWKLVISTGILLLFNQTLADNYIMRRISLAMRLIGAAILGYYMLIYVQPGGAAASPAGWWPLRWMRCIFFDEGNWLHGQWWEIIGLIGWAYMTAGIIYLALRRYGEMIYLGLVFLVVAATAAKLGRFDSVPVLSRYAGFLFNDAVVVLLGAGLGVMMFKASGNIRASYGILIRFAVLCAAMVAITSPWAGIVCTPAQQAQGGIYKFMFAVDKEGATLGWMLSTGFFGALLWITLYYICDVRKIDNVAFRFIKKLGSVPLTAYIWQFWIFSFLNVTGLLIFRWNEKYCNRWLSALISFLVTVLVCYVAVFCKNRKFSLKL